LCFFYYSTYLFFFFQYFYYYFLFFCFFRNGNTKWIQLQRLRKSASPIDKESLVVLISSDYEKVDFLNDLIQNSVELGCAFNTLISFYGNIMSLSISTPARVTETFSARLMPALLNSFRSNNENWKVCGYLLVSQLASRVSYSQDVVNSLIDLICATITNTQQSLSCLFVISQTQRPNSLSSHSVKNLSARNDLLSVLSAAQSKKYDISIFLHLLLTSLVPLT